MTATDGAITKTYSKGILGSEHKEARYITNSTNVDGIRAQEIRESLAEDVQEELGHAQQFAARVKELYGVVPGSADFRRLFEGFLREFEFEGKA